MIVLFSDFGLEGPYIGQVKAVLHGRAPGLPVVDLFSDAPAFDPQLSAYLLAAYAEGFEPGTVFLAVVDPGVGSDRPALVLQTGSHWFVGPGNGLFEIAARRAEAVGQAAVFWRLDSVPENASASFHGRDVFAPVAAELAVRGAPPSNARIDDSPSLRRGDWPDDLPRIVYVDGFGNAMTGLRAATLRKNARLSIGGRTLERARTFSDVSPGAAFWYENANGLAEIAVNQGRAADLPEVRIGATVQLNGGPG